MESKYIKGTNKQYSIREDGAVFIHFRKQRITNTRIDIIKCYDRLKPIRNCVSIVYPHKVMRLSVNTLLFESFSYKYCYSCKSKFKPNISKRKCDNCRVKNRKDSAKKYTKEWSKNNPEIIKQRVKADTKAITKRYVAGILDLKVAELPDEIYNEYRNLILYKRKIAKENNVSIYSLQ